MRNNNQLPQTRSTSRRLACTRNLTVALKLRDFGLVLPDDVADFDFVFQADTPQTVLYDRFARPVVNTFLNGFDGCILAYGQSGTGKTYTLEGQLDDPNNRGIAPRVATHIFSPDNETAEEFHVSQPASLSRSQSEVIYGRIVLREIDRSFIQ